MDLFSKTIKNLSFEKNIFVHKFKFTMWFQNTTLKKKRVLQSGLWPIGNPDPFFLEFSLLKNYDDNTKLKESFLITNNMNITFAF